VSEALRGLAYEGGYDAVRRNARNRQRDPALTSADALVRLNFMEVLLIKGSFAAYRIPPTPTRQCQGQGSSTDVTDGSNNRR
jgi:hypothetical protein